MTNLRMILEKKAEIVELVKRFGYSEEVRILNDPSHRHVTTNKPILQFLVARTPHTSSLWEISGWLAAKLTELLNCEVDIVTRESVKSLYKNYVIDNSVLIENEETLCKLFKVTSLESVVFEEIDEEFYPAVLKHANQYLETSVSKEKQSPDAESLGRHSLLSEAKEREPKIPRTEADDSHSPDRESTASTSTSKTPSPNSK